MASGAGGFEEQVMVGARERPVEPPGHTKGAVGAQARRVFRARAVQTGQVDKLPGRAMVKIDIATALAARPEEI